MKGPIPICSRIAITLIAVLFVVSTWSSAALAIDAKSVLRVLNEQFGMICTASLEGWFSKTLKIDWTAQTTKFHTIQVFAGIASVKADLYNDGVRYLKFPNDAGGYNIIDWKTGEKTSIRDRAPFYFR